MSPRVLAAQGSLLTNKYADGYPGHRHYAGCEQADVVEQLAIDRAQRLFGAGYANVQPYSGSQANLAVYLALLSPGDTLLGMRPAHGGHRTHGAADNQSGSLYNVVPYDVAASGRARLRARSRRSRASTGRSSSSPASRRTRVSSTGRASARSPTKSARCFSRTSRTSRARRGPGLYPNPVAARRRHDDDDAQDAARAARRHDPRAAPLALTERIDAAVFPGTQGGPLMHVIAAKAVAFQEALEPSFAAYQRQTLANARAMAAGLIARGYKSHDGRHRQPHAARRSARRANRRGARRARAARRAHRRESRLVARRDRQRADARRRRLAARHAGRHDARPRASPRSAR